MVEQNPNPSTGTSSSGSRTGACPPSMSFDRSGAAITVWGVLGSPPRAIPALAPGLRVACAAVRFALGPISSKEINFLFVR